MEREIRGGFATIFTMAYVVVLNPIILSAGVDKLFAVYFALDPLQRALS
ncbi:MAG: hypothetical protein NVSMB55_03120 [Mycobacteriales bacterium]